MIKKWVISATLLGACVLWVLAVQGMSLLGQIASPHSVAASNGSVAAITLVDESRFESQAGEVSLQLDIRGANRLLLPGIGQSQVRVTEDGQPGKILEWNGPGTQSLNVILVMDISGSMAGEKIVGAKEAALAAIDSLRVDRDRLGIIAFDDTPHEVQALAELTASVRDSCRQSVQSLQLGGGTNIGDPTRRALQLFREQGLK